MSTALIESNPSTALIDVPVLPLRDIVIYPHTLIPLFISREMAIKALKAVTASTDEKQQIVLVAQKTAFDRISKLEDLYSIGTIANVFQLLKVADGSAKVVVEGKQRCKLTSLQTDKGYLTATIEPFIAPFESKQEKTVQALMRTVLDQFDQYISLQTKNIPVEIVSILSDLDDPDRLSDMIAMHLSLRTQDKQSLLEIFDVKARLKKLSLLLQKELELLQMQQKLRKKLQEKVTKTHKEFFLKEQMAAIKEELSGSQESINENEKLAESIKKAKMPKETHQKAINELKKLDAMPSISAEATVSRNYIDALINLPWHQRTKRQYSLQQAESTLNADHYGLDKIKERILEFLAVTKRVKKFKGSILCFAGPPGVGKTSLGKSIASAMGLKFTRISLGGVRDEAEIRGHRRTYVGAIPGQIIQRLTKLNVKNPLIMLDEIDKMAAGFRGDPASALLEVLDPEHNHSFIDHYLEVPFDLSEVFFIATANDIQYIPPALLDRMEIIRLSGYTEDEKLNIAKQYLVPKQAKQHGLESEELAINDAALTELIRYYTLEAGVRNLERETATLCRKTVMQLSKTKEAMAHITSDNLEDYLGIKKFRYGLANTKNRIGEVNGLAWTAARGELLKIESVTMPGKGKITYTGHLGEVMQESIQTAFNVVKVRSKQLGINIERYSTLDIHVHVPEGATPKDGPSAGIGMCTAIASTLTQQPVRADVAMTGEVTLLGKVLPIGGLKEKLLAAQQGGIRVVIIPKDNERELKEIPSSAIGGLEIHRVQSIEEVFNLALCDESAIDTESDVSSNLINSSAHPSMPATLKREIQ